MTLTQQNYFEVGITPENPVLSSSLIRHLRPGDGGSIEKLRYELENYDALREQRSYNFSLEYGTLLHKYMENPGAFAIADFTRPGEKVVDVVEATFQACLGRTNGVYEHIGGLHDWGDIILVACNALEYYPKWKDDTRVNKIIEQGEEYFNFLVEKGDSHVLNEKEHEILTNVIDKWVTSELYAPDNQIEWLREVPILWEQVTPWGRIKAKSLLDKLYINHGTRTIIIEDIKTTRSIVGFIARDDVRMGFGGEPERRMIPGPFISYRYYRQLAFYRRAVNYQIAANGGNPSEYNIECRILAFENGPPYSIKMYKAPEEWLKAGDEEIDEAFAELKYYHEQYAPEF